MSTIEATVSLMEGMSEDARVKVLEYAQDLFRSKKQTNPFVPLTRKEILEDLNESRQQIADGKGVSAETVMEEIGKKHGFI